MNDPILNRRKALALSLGGLAGLIVPAGLARARNDATGLPGGPAPAPPSGSAGAPPRLGGLSVNVSTGPVSILFEMEGPAWPGVYPLAVQAMIGHANRERHGDVLPGTLLFRSFSSHWKASGRRGYRYGFTFRQEGWPEHSPADFGALWPDGPVPQDIYGRGQCDVYPVLSGAKPAGPVGSLAHVVFPPEGEPAVLIGRFGA